MLPVRRRSCDACASDVRVQKTINEMIDSVNKRGLVETPRAAPPPPPNPDADRRIIFHSPYRPRSVCDVKKVTGILFSLRDELSESGRAIVNARAVADANERKTAVSPLPVSCGPEQRAHPRLTIADRSRACPSLADRLVQRNVHRYMIVNAF
ncbi:hypothetical protein EVAR_96809_1 [Eumeta japonica]|uniref:Uncharacterized protein n=1 Tax=Eumeta variegata TaxID=151549 RepID=A0A4C1WBD9_EUMVA|nr:hypothetical protein EVAR_96809_1 [Eumeta japonica]